MTGPDTTKAVPAGRRVFGDVDIAVRTRRRNTALQSWRPTRLRCRRDSGGRRRHPARHHRDPATVTADRISGAVRACLLHGDLQRFLGTGGRADPGRRPLSGADPIDWDEATVHQAT